MKKLRIVRVEKSPAGLIGVLLIDGVVECFILMPDPANPTLVSIPEGFYTCRRFHGFKYKDTFEIIVPGHTALLFHTGNTEPDTTGCILLGEQVGYLNGQRAVLVSGVAFEQFMKALWNEDVFDLFIEDCYGEWMQ